MNDILALTEALLRKKSITPDDAGCHVLIEEYLKNTGFKIEHIHKNGVSNLWMTHGQGAPCFVFAGHTDVVPPGALSEWHTDPFIPTIKEGELFARGAADMKSGLAAMIIAAKNIAQKKPHHSGTLGLLITSDEEGHAEHGTKAVIKILNERKLNIDYCIVGEATSAQALGDAIRVGRRGSLHGHLTIQGTAGHVAYPDKVNNILHLALPALEDLTKEIWDSGNTVFPPTSLQIINVHSNSPAENSTSSQLKIHINFRFSNSVTDTDLKNRVEALFKKHHLNLHAEWRISAQPFYTAPGTLIKTTENTIKKICGINTKFSTAGGTSDARFIAAHGAQVIELGPINASIHKANECVKVSDLTTLCLLYEEIATNMLKS